MFLEGSEKLDGRKTYPGYSPNSSKGKNEEAGLGDLVLTPSRLQEVDEEFISRIYSKDNNGDVYWNAKGDGTYTNPVFTNGHTSGSSFQIDREPVPATRAELKESRLFSSKGIKQTLEEISIPGFKTIFGKRAKLPRRSMWTFILVTCALTSGFQIQDRVFYYLSSPVAVSVRVSRNETLRFPVITICNKNIFNVTALTALRNRVFMQKNETPPEGTPGVDWNISELIGFNGMNAKDVWDAGSHDFNLMLNECWFGRNKSCATRGQWKKIYTYMGTCYSYSLSNTSVRLSGVFNNLYLKLEETEKVIYNQDDGWKLLVHDERDSAVIEIRTHGSSVYRGMGKDMRLYMRSFKTLNTKERPCTNNVDYSWSRCNSQCFVAAVAQRTPCLLPYMEGVPGEYCSTPESYNRATRIADNLLFYGEWSSSNCTCPRQCSEDIFLPYTETGEIEDKRGKLRVYFQDLTFDDITEAINYTAIPLLCDIGGAMGLLLGASLLTFFEILEAISIAFFVSGKTVKKKMSRRKQSRNKEHSVL